MEINVMNKDIFSSDRKIIDLNSKDMFSYETFNSDEMMKMSECEIDEERQIIKNAPMISLDKVSRNGSMYEGKMIMESLEAPYIKELFQRGTFFSELEHPDPNCSRERFLKVDKDNVCGRFMNWHHEKSKNMLRGDYQFVQPKGYIPWDWLHKGINFGWSVRILTPNYEERTDANGNPYVYKHTQGRMTAIDLVSITGFKEASIVEDVDNYRGSMENWDGIRTSWTASKKKDEMKKLLESQETLPIIEDIYGFSMKDVSKISYSNEGLITLIVEEKKNYTKAVKIPTNVYRVNRALMSGY
jgi:hypothetical protein